jgi:hypothetical protein
MTYRISGDAQHGYRVIKDDSWSDANLSLVITCGSDGIVTRHALVAVKEAAP